MAASSFELVDQGEGRFALSGDMSFATANHILRASERAFAGHASLQVDMSGVKKADSAGLALLIEWKSQAGNRKAEIRFVAVPGSLVAIAETAEVSELL